MTFTLPTRQTKPVSEADHIQAVIQMWRNSNFKDHVATVVCHTDNLLFIEWRKPGQWNYAMRFLIHAGWVCVMGDVGEATYQWSDNTSLEFLARIDFGYFKSKCRASPSGREFKTFDSGVAAHRIAEYFRHHDGDAHHGFIAELQAEASDPCKDELERIAHVAYDQTGDCELASQIASFGTVPDFMCIGHYVGIQMAATQLLAAEPPAPSLITEN